MGSTFGFDRELWRGGVAGVGDVDIDLAREGKVGGSVLLPWTEIVFDTGWSEKRRVHTNSVEKKLK